MKPTQEGRVMVERPDRMWSTGEGNGKPLQYSCPENPMNSMNSMLFIDPSFFYTHMLFSLNFFPSFSLFRETSGKSFFWHFILSCPVCVPFMGIYIHILIYMCVYTFGCVYIHTPFIYILIVFWYIPIWSKKNSQRFYIKHNTDSGALPTSSR